MRLAIDAMGNDRGCAPIVKGVAQYLREFPDVQVVLVGDEARLRDGMKQYGLTEDSGAVEIVHASQVVEMHDKFQDFREKKDSSIARLVGVMKDGGADGMVALGNTMAAVGAATLGLRHLEGVKRAGIAVPMPSKNARVCLSIDMGANINAKPIHLAGYGIMASVYAEKVLHMENPRVGLLNVGEERGKGNDLLNEAYALLEKAPVNFIGNVEGKDIFMGGCDVTVCDGFVGNAVLKGAEGLARLSGAWVREGMMKNWLTKIGSLLAKWGGGFDVMRERGSAAVYGGAPLLGINGTCIIGHGGSSPEGVYNALRVAAESVQGRVNQTIREHVAELNQQVAAGAAQAE